MLRLIRVEFMKLRRRRLFRIAFLTTFLMPVFYTMIIAEVNLDNLMSVIQEENGFLLLIPLSVVTAANLFFAEHDHDTLKNLLCVPVGRGHLAIAKLSMILLFDIAYELAGFCIVLLIALFKGISLQGLFREFLITLGCSVLLWAAALPCLVLVVWCNRSYIISVLIAFAYTVLGYILHISDQVIMVPFGCNLPSLLPVPVIFRWLYQFHSLEGAGEAMTAFYENFRPYFVSTPAVFLVLLAEAALCTFLMIRIYKKQDH